MNQVAWDFGEPSRAAARRCLQDRIAFCRVRTADHDSRPQRERPAVRTLPAPTDLKCRVGVLADRLFAPLSDVAGEYTHPTI